MDASWPGSSHDSLIFTASGLREILIRFPGKCVIGDKGYPCTTFCQSPYRARRGVPFTPAQVHYNELLARERLIIERSFGILKRRFAILQHPLRVKPERRPILIMACLILHNVSIHLNDPIEDNWTLISETPVPLPVTRQNEPQSAIAERRRGHALRDTIAARLYRHCVRG